MKQKLLNLKSWLLMMCLLVGVGSAWADEATLSISSGFTSNGNLNDNQSNSWAITSDGSYTSSNSYIQVGTNKAEVSYLKLSTSAYSSKTISKIQVWGTSKANTDVTAKVSIGGNQLGESSAYTTQNAVGGGTEFSVNNTNGYKGEILIEISRPSSATGAIYFNKLIVTYSEGGGTTPEPTKYNVTVANDIANGTVTASPTSAKEGDEVTLTATPATGYEFGSWNVTDASNNIINVSNNKFKMPAANVNVSASFNQIQGGGDEPSEDGYTHDVLTSSDLAATGTSYADFSNVKKNTAVYAGNSALNNGISIRTNNSNSGIVSTTSGGKIKTVTVTWNSNTTSGRTIDIYGRNTAYKQATDLYDSSKRGTKLGSIVYGTSTSFTITGDYAYVGVRSNSSALIIDNIEFAWEEESTKTLSSIAVKTAPTKVTYTEDENFDPAGLVITATYDDENTEVIAYSGNESKFTFNPALTDALTTSNTSVTITYNEKSCNQAITVNAIPTYILTIAQPTEGGVLTVKNGDVTLENGANVRVGTNLTCEVTGIPEGKRFSRFYAKWGEGDGESKYKQTNPATFDNIATENITACEIYVTYKDIQHYTINYMINGENTNPQENVEEKTPLTFPTAPATIGGKSFIGWTEKEITGIDDEEPTLVNTSEQTATANKTYYAVYATKGEGGAATYTKATSLAVGDKVVFGLGEADGKPAQAVTGANSGATISATESEWIVYTAVEYPEKGIVLQMPNGEYQRTAKGEFDFTPNNPSTMSTNASSHIIGYGQFTLYHTQQQGNRFYSNKQDGYVEFLMWKVEGGASYSDFTTSPLPTFESLDALIKAGYTKSTVVNVTINDKLTGDGMYFESGHYLAFLSNEVSIWAPGSDLGWKQGGTVTGTLENVTWSPKTSDKNSNQIISETNIWPSLTYVPTFDSLDDLIAADLQDGTVVNVTINDVVDYVWEYDEYSVLLRNSEIRLEAPASELKWLPGGTVTGTLKNVKWSKTYSILKGDSEDFWNDLTYTKPEIKMYESLKELLDENLTYVTIVSVNINNQISDVYYDQDDGKYWVSFENSAIYISGYHDDLGWEKGGTVTGILTNVEFNPEGGFPMLSLYDGDIFEGLTYTAPVTKGTIAMRATDGDKYYATFSCDKDVIIKAFEGDDIYHPLIEGVCFVWVDDEGELALQTLSNPNPGSEFSNAPVTDAEQALVAGFYVPKNTGVLVISGNNNDVEYYFVNEAAENNQLIFDNASAEKNMLRPSSVPMEEENFKFYKLAYDAENPTDHTKLGFYWGNLDGKAFESKAGLAYLAVPEGIEIKAKGFSFVDIETTGIKNVNHSAVEGNVMYNLAGQRVNKNAKGIVIVNGKKMLNK